MKEINYIKMLLALVDKTENMGQFDSLAITSKEVKDLLWNMFHCRVPESTAVHFTPGCYVYEYNDTPTYEHYSLRIVNEEGEFIYLYYIG